MVAEVFGRPEVQGNIAATVALLEREHPEVDWNYQRVYKLISQTRALKAQAPSTDPEKMLPTAGDIVDRPPLLPPAELEEAKALVRQETRLQLRDWTDLGLTEDQGKRMLSMERFSQQPLKHMIHTTHGGMMFVLSTLIANFEDTAMRIQKSLLPSEVDAKGDPRPEIDVERDWHGVLLKYSSEIRAIADQVTRSNVLILKAKQLENDGKAGGKKRGKPGFAPMLVQAQPGSTVNLNGNGG